MRRQNQRSDNIQTNDGFCVALNDRGPVGTMIGRTAVCCLEAKEAALLKRNKRFGRFFLGSAFGGLTGRRLSR
jgi:hypothetical protein